MEHNACYELFLNAKDKINSIDPDYLSALEELNKIEKRSITMCIEHMKIICLYMLNKQEDIIEYYYTHKAEVQSYCRVNEEFKKIIAAAFYSSGMKKKANEFYPITIQYEITSFNNDCSFKPKNVISYQIENFIHQYLIEKKSNPLHTIIEQPSLDEKSLDANNSRIIPSIIKNSSTKNDNYNEINENVNPSKVQYIGKNNEIKKAKTHKEKETCNSDNNDLLNENSQSHLSQTQINYNTKDMLNSNTNLAEFEHKIENSSSQSLDQQIKESNANDKESEHSKNITKTDKENDKDKDKESSYEIKSQEGEIKHALTNISIPKPRSEREIMVSGNHLSKKNSEKKASYDDKYVNKKSQLISQKNETEKKTLSTKTINEDNFDNIQLIPNIKKEDSSKNDEIKHAKTINLVTNNILLKQSDNDNPGSLRSQKNKPVNKLDEIKEVKNETEVNVELIEDSKRIKDKENEEKREKEVIKDNDKGEDSQKDKDDKNKNENIDKGKNLIDENIKNDGKEDLKELSMFEDRIKAKEEDNEKDTFKKTIKEIKETNEDIIHISKTMPVQNNEYINSEHSIKESFEKSNTIIQNQSINKQFIYQKEDDKSEMKKEIESQIDNKTENIIENIIKENEIKNKGEEKEEVIGEKQLEKEYERNSKDEIKVNESEISDNKAKEELQTKQEKDNENNDFSDNPSNTVPLIPLEQKEPEFEIENNNGNIKNSEFEVKEIDINQDDKKETEKTDVNIPPEEDNKNDQVKACNEENIVELIKEDRPEEGSKLNDSIKEKNNKKEQQQFDQLSTHKQEECLENEENIKKESNEKIAAMNLDQEIMQINQSLIKNYKKQQEDDDEFNTEREEDKMKEIDMNMNINNDSITITKKNEEIEVQKEGDDQSIKNHKGTENEDKTKEQITDNKENLSKVNVQEQGMESKHLKEECKEGNIIIKDDNENEKKIEQDKESLINKISLKKEIDPQIISNDNSKENEIQVNTNEKIQVKDKLELRIEVNESNNNNHDQFKPQTKEVIQISNEGLFDNFEKEDKQLQDDEIDKQIIIKQIHINPLTIQDKDNSNVYNNETEKELIEIKPIDNNPQINNEGLVSNQLKEENSPNSNDIPGEKITNVLILLISTIA